MHLRFVHAAACAAVVALSLPAGAEGPGTLIGTVRTADGAPLPQVVLRLDGPGGARRLVSGVGGRFRAESLPPGDYRLAADSPGLGLTTQPSVSISDRTERVELTLVPAGVREQVVVSATRGEAAVSTLGASVASLDRQQIDDRAAPSTLDLLRELPGVSVARAGGTGLVASAFVRGGDSNYHRVLIDGVPVNQPGGSFDLGSAMPLELERVELVRGAASSLYGTDALAGVMQFITRSAAPGEPAFVRGELEGGRFDWRRGYLGSTGRAGDASWNAGVQRLETDNQQPNSAFRQTALAAALGAQLDARSSLRLIARFEDGHTGTPGPTAFGRPDLDARFERDDLTLGARLQQGFERFGHELSAGLARTRQLTLNPLDSGSYVPRFGGRVGAFPLSDFPDPLGFQNETARLSLGYKADLALGTRHLLTSGVDVERETGEIGGRGDAGGLLSPERTNAGLYVQDRAVFGERVFVTLGGRLERNASFGWRAVPRAALAVRVRGGADAAVLKASAGAGIKEPDFFESFGISFFARGNPDLKPERSRTFDVGLEQRLLGGRLRLEATAFHHTYLDQIAYTVLDFNTFQGSYVNVGRSRARGLELAASAAPARGLTFSGTYTLLDTEIVIGTSDFDPVYAAGRALLRRPRHQGTLTAQGALRRVTLAATLVAVGRRADSDFSGLGLDSNAGHARLDARARVDLGHGLEAFLVAENLLDRAYMDVLGYPALGRGVRGGLRVRATLR
jgi:outer membrane cobalamin receptor